MFGLIPLTSLPALAIMRTVSPDGTADYTSIQLAITESAPGDTVIAFGDAGPFNENLSIDRRIVLIGQGTGCGGVGATEVNDVDLTGTSSGSVLKGFRIAGSDDISLAASVTGVFIQRCVIDNSDINNGSCVTFAAGSSAEIEECVLLGDYNCILAGGANVQVGARNTVFCNSSRGIDSYNLSTVIALQNCVFVSSGNCFVDAGNWSIDHCMFWDNNQINGLNLGNVTANWNVFVVTTPVNFPFDTTGAGTDTVVFQNPFVYYASAPNYEECITDLHLVASSGLINWGNPNAPNDRDGTRRDPGIYGGPNPYVIGGAPDFPFVTSFLVPPSVPQNGVLEIRATGRVGTGVGE